MPIFQFQTILDFKKSEHEKMLLLLVQIEQKLDSIREQIKSSQNEKKRVETQIQKVITTNFSIFRVQLLKDGISFLNGEIIKLEKELSNTQIEYQKQLQIVRKAQIEIEKFQLMREEFFLEHYKKQKEYEKKEIDEVNFIREFHKKNS